MFISIKPMIIVLISSFLNFFWNPISGIFRGYSSAKINESREVDYIKEIIDLKFGANNT